MASDDVDVRDSDLCSPPSWEALSRIGESSDIEDGDDPDLDANATERSANRNPDESDDDGVKSKHITDKLFRYLRGDGMIVEENEGTNAKLDCQSDYVNTGLKGCFMRQSISRHKSPILNESDGMREFGYRPKECDDTSGVSAQNGDDEEVFSSGGGQVKNEGLSQRSRTSSDRDSESVYDTVSSTSSAAPLLRKITHYFPEAKADIRPSESPVEKTAPKSNSVESFGKALLAKTLEQVKKSLEDLSPSREAEVYHSIMGGPGVYKVSRIYLKNLTVLSLCFMILHTAFFALRNLQSSINHESGLGLVGLSCLSASYIVSCLFAPSIVQKVRPKYAMIFSMSGHLLFQMANFYSSFYTIIPASLFLGCTMASLWVAQGSYLTSIAVTYASVTGKGHEGIIGLFNGFFLFWLQTAQILGNLLSSFVFNISLWSNEKTDPPITGSPALHEGQQTAEPPGFHVIDLDRDVAMDRHWIRSVGRISNQTADDRSFCGALYCHSYTISHPGLQLGEFSLYVLLGIFLALTALSMGSVALFLDKLDVIFRKNNISLKQQLTMMVRFHSDYKVWLLCVLLIFVGMQQAHMFGEVTKAFINCPLGIHMIGYVMVCFGACDSLVSVTCGQLQRCSSTKVFITFGAILHMALLVVMLLWQPSANDVYLVFLFAGSLGAVDAIWQTQLCNLIGYLFPSDREAAFGCLRMYEGIGFTVAFAYAQFLCMAIKTYILIGVLLLGVCCYYVMEYLERKYKTVVNSFPPVDV